MKQLAVCSMILIVPLLAGCRPGTTPADTPVAATGPETADRFIARVNDEYRAMTPEMAAAQWLSSTYINSDSQLLSSAANERWLTRLNLWIEQAGQFDRQPMSDDTARALALLTRKSAMPAPRDAGRLAELTQIATRLEGLYGAGRDCDEDGRSCRQLGELEAVLRNSRDHDQQLDAWRGWHGIATPMREDYIRFVELVNEGARDMGYADAGELWRSAYEMEPRQVREEAQRLWEQVGPLYEQLHCYAGTELEKVYPGQATRQGGLIAGHLLGNMWQQDWANLWDVLQPYPDVAGIDAGIALEQRQRDALNRHLGALNRQPGVIERAAIERQSQLDVAIDMTRLAESFYTSIGLQALPESFWQRSQFIKPLDRDVVCHASAWPMDMGDDVRIKMCIEPTEETFKVIHHELGHVYYFLAYQHLPPLFQEGAHDGFHEAIGDTMVLAMTPGYLAGIDLIDTPEQSEAAVINTQMRMALSKVAFLPFGLMIDQWRWGVFDGSIPPEQYNQAWWRLKARYQGVAPGEPRGEEYFDAGAKYHVPGNTPYLRYFFSHILQFQFYKALCDASGHTGPLNECSFHGSEAAGERLQTMLSRGTGQPWQRTLQDITGSTSMDAQPLLEYFAPLAEWLRARNADKSCGWENPSDS